MAVVTSKKVHSMPSPAIDLTWGTVTEAMYASSSSVMCVPSTDILSLKFIMWGDVNSPVLTFPSISTPDIIAQTDPFPSVPATWMLLNDSWGLPMRRSSSAMFLSPSFIPCTLRPYSQSRNFSLSAFSMLTKADYRNPI